MGLSSPTSLAGGNGGGLFAGGAGSVQPVTPPDAASESVAAGNTLADVTFSAFTDPGSRIASYAATKTNVSGSATISGSGLGPYAISGDADGEVLTIELDAKDSAGEVVATAVYTGAIAPASDGPSVVLSTADFGAYDFTTTGGTGGSGGAGPHTLPDGTTCTIHVTGGGSSVFKIENGLLVADGDTSNFYTIEFDLGADTEWVPTWISGAYTFGETTASGSVFIKTGEASGTTGNAADDLQILTLSSSSVRFRFANSSSTFNDVLDLTGLSLDATDQFEFILRGCNAWSTVEGRQGIGTLPAWNSPVMSNIDGDVRNAIPSFRRYLYIRGGMDASLNLKVWKAL